MRQSKQSAGIVLVEPLGLKLALLTLPSIFEFYGHASPIGDFESSVFAEQFVMVYITLNSKAHGV